MLSVLAVHLCPCAFHLPKALFELILHFHLKPQVPLSEVKQHLPPPCVAQLFQLLVPVGIHDLVVLFDPLILTQVASVLLLLVLDLCDPFSLLQLHIDLVHRPFLLTFQVFQAVFHQFTVLVSNILFLLG
jgi:hypothetical protein